MNLHISQRPKEFYNMVGQDVVTEQLRSQLIAGTFPHACLFSGESGVGKTTAARIIKEALNCGEANYHEMNAADVRGIDHIRSIIGQMAMKPLGGGPKMFVIDECHQLTTAAQQALLKPLEDCPAHVYFLLLTSEPAKMIKAIKTRCQSFAFSTVSDSDMMDLLKRTLKEIKPTNKDGLKELCEAIVERSGGSPRQALVHLEAALAVEPEQRLQVVKDGVPEGEARELAKACVSRNWPEAQKALKRLDGVIRDNPEGVRRQVLGYCASIVLNSGNVNAFNTAANFADHMFDSGRAGIILAAFQSCKG